MMPDKYRLGYMMLTKIRNEKGNDITANVLKGAASYKSIIYPFSRSLKRQTGYTTKKLYELAWAEKKIDFKNQISEIKQISIPITKKNKTTFTIYRFPCITVNGDIVARKISYKSTDEIVLLSNGLEKKRIHINDAIIVFLFNCIFFVNTAIAKSITIQVMGEIRKSRIFDK
jgi:hypothetical protein